MAPRKTTKGKAADKSKPPKAALASRVKKVAAPSHRPRGAYLAREYNWVSSQGSQGSRVPAAHRIETWNLMIQVPGVAADVVIPVEDMLVMSRDGREYADVDLLREELVRVGVHGSVSALRVNNAALSCDHHLGDGWALTGLLRDGMRCFENKRGAHVLHLTCDDEDLKRILAVRHVQPLIADKVAQPLRIRHRT